MFKIEKKGGCEIDRGTEKRKTERGKRKESGKITERTWCICLLGIICEKVLKDLLVHFLVVACEAVGDPPDKLHVPIYPCSKTKCECKR